MEDPRRTARELLQRKHLGVIDLWILYWNDGGRSHPFEFDGFIHDVLPASWFDLEALAGAVEKLSFEVSA